ncbi:MAG: hypothetical protein KGK30_03725, partial [Elusimicrobia bacterium]|nr:hypothetical protein [Elusimicrobiota bacterium]
ADGLLSADGRIYRFPIRKDVRFQDGRPLTPQDVRYSILRFMLQDGPGGPASLLLEPIFGLSSTRGPDGRLQLGYKEAAAAVRVEGDDVVVELKRPSEQFLKVLAALPLVVSRSWCAEHGEWDGGEASWKRYNGRPDGQSYLDSHMNGTGPFMLETLAPDMLVLARNPHYWRKPAALSEVYLRVVRNPATRLWMLENGDADSAYLEDQNYEDASDISGVRIIDPPYHTSLGETLFFTFAIDPASPYLGSGKLDGDGIPPDFFSDADVRRGFAAAIDYEGYLRRGLGRRGLRANSAFPASLLLKQPKVAPRYDIAAARQDFQRAWGGRLWKRGFTLTLAFNPGSASRRVLADILKAGLAKVNPLFKLRILVLPTERFYDALEAHRLPLFVDGYDPDYPDPLSMALGLLYSGGYYPRAQRFSDPGLDALIEKAETMAGGAQRHDLLRQAIRRAAQDLPQIYTYNPTRMRARRSWVVETAPLQNVNNLNLENSPYFYSLSKR